MTTERERKDLGKRVTNTYVWGEGQQVDATLDFSNWTPKNLKNFKGK